MTFEETFALFESHAPIHSEWPCDLCGSHEEWRCVCGWDDPNFNGVTGNSKEDWMAHVKEAYREHLG